MTNHVDSEVADSIRSTHVRMMQAMVDGDAVALGACLSESYELTHMTGYLQQRTEWLGAVSSGQMTYHSIEDGTVSVRLDHGAPELTARSHTDATIWGVRSTWRLQLRTTFVYECATWKAAKTHATTW
jgi:hypothetical protein